MQNIDRWRSNQFQPTDIWNPWSNKIDANLEDSACTVRVLLFFPIVQISTSQDSQTTLKPNLDRILGQIAT